MQKATDEVSLAILLLIGVTGVPVNPATSFAELVEGPLPAAWAGGAVSPLTIRGLSGCFLHLPAGVRRIVGQLLVDSANIHEGDVAGRFALVQRLMQFADPDFDSFPVAPLLSINLQAPQNAIVDAVKEYVRTEKARLDIPERRNRDESLPDFLTVWDLREGWTGCAYDRAHFKSLRQIAQETTKPIETIRNRYNSAFRYITGHEYSPELWFRLIGILKISQVFGTDAPHWKSLRRPTHSRRKQDIPITRLTSDGAAGVDAINAAANQVGAGHADEAQLFTEIVSLIASGASNVEIIEALELCSHKASDLIDEIRLRQADGL